MTKIKRKFKPTWHETGAIDSCSGRVFVVAESPSALLIRLKGTRQVLELPWVLAYLKAASVAAGLQRLQKINARRRAKSVRRGIFGT